MNFIYNVVTKAIFGKGCVQINRALFNLFGKRALIVTGEKSGKESGALNDVRNALDERNIAFSVYNRAENNPTPENVKEASEIAAEEKAELIVGIGGGSPLDASKAVAVLAVNKMDPIELFTNKFNVKPLPVIAIPTTAGTGSEVTPYSILTRKDIETKMSFGNDDTFPRIAFLDPAYTTSLPLDVTIDTAIDALSHCMEGYLSKRSTPISDKFAEEGIEAFAACSHVLLKREKPGYDTREKLLYASMLGGMVISHTGTTIVHGMGYNLTYFKGIPHGRANGYYLKAYLEYIHEYARQKTEKIYRLLGLDGNEAFGVLMKALLAEAPALSNEEIDKYTAITMNQRSTQNNIRHVEPEDISGILRRT